MSRYDGDGDYDEDFPGQAALWEANARRALSGKRGRKVLADLRDALRALPEKRLISSALCTVKPDQRRPDPERSYAVIEFNDIVEEQGEGVCAVGAYLWHKRVKDGMDPEQAFESLPTLPDYDDGLYETATQAKNVGVVFSVAWELAYRNDEMYGDKTPEQRYAAFMAWLDKQLAAVSA